jgi:UDPglucose 6-dehydrogenase
MKIGIVGNGFVGKATQILGRFKSDKVSATCVDVLVYDIRPEACIPPNVTLSDLESACDLIFFCLPTPLNHDNSCYTTILEETIANIHHPFKVVRSTVPVGFSEMHGCYFMPEFLTEANWENDFVQTKRWVFGIPSTASPYEATRFKQLTTALLEEATYAGAIQSAEVDWLTTNEAEMLKLVKNCFLAAKVSIFNEVYDLCSATGTDYKNVMKIAAFDPRIGNTHAQIPGPDGKRGFGGTCFPKDTHSLVCQFQKHGVNSIVFPAVLQRNDTHDRTQREWAHDVWRTTVPRKHGCNIVVIIGANEHSKQLTARHHLGAGDTVIYVIDSVKAKTLVDSHVSFADDLNTNPHFLVRRIDLSKPFFFPHIDSLYFVGFDPDIHDNDAAKYTIQYKLLAITHIIDVWKSHPDAVINLILSKHVDSSDDLNIGGIFSAHIEECFNTTGKLLHFHAI